MGGESPPQINKFLASLHVNGARDLARKKRTLSCWGTCRHCPVRQRRPPYPIPRVEQFKCCVVRFLRCTGSYSSLLCYQVMRAGSGYLQGFQETLIPYPISHVERFKCCVVRFLRCMGSHSLLFCYQVMRAGTRCLQGFQETLISLFCTCPYRNDSYGESRLNRPSFDLYVALAFSCGQLPSSGYRIWHFLVQFLLRRFDVFHLPYIILPYKLWLLFFLLPLPSGAQRCKLYDTRRFDCGRWSDGRAEERIKSRRC